MSYTKRQFVLGALEEIGLGADAFDVTPEQAQSALRRLDALMASWEFEGIRLGYPLPNSPEDSDLDEETNVPDSANRAILTNLALEIASSYGKMPLPSTTKNAFTSYNKLVSQFAQPISMQLPERTPLGAGNKTWRNSQDPFANTPEFGIELGHDSFLEGS